MSSEQKKEQTPKFSKRSRGVIGALVGVCAICAIVAFSVQSDDAPPMTIQTEKLPDETTVHAVAETSQLRVETSHDLECRWEPLDGISNDNETKPQRVCDLYQWQCIKETNKETGEKVSSCNGDKRIYQGTFAVYQNMTVACRSTTCLNKTMLYVAAIYADKQKSAAEKAFHADLSYENGRRFELSETNKRLKLTVDTRPLRARRRQRRLEEQTLTAKEPERSIQKPKRRKTSASPTLTAGGFNNAFRNILESGYVYKLPGDVVPRSSISGEWYEPHATYGAKNLELAVSTLPDVQIEAIRRSGTLTEVVGTMDFSLGSKCKQVVQATVEAHVSARACIGFIFWEWCYVNVNSNGIVKVGMSPKIAVRLELRPSLQNGKLGVSYKFGKSSVSVMDFNADTPGVNMDSALGVVGAGIGALISPIGGIVGWIAGFGVNRYLEHVIRKYKDEFVSTLPSKVNTELQKVIDENLSKVNGVLEGGVGVAALAALLSQNLDDSISSRKLLATRLSEIPQALAGVALLPQPNKIQCKGSGLIRKVDQRCVTDYGTNGDSALEVYCYDGFERYCLSRELCPWRGHENERCAANFALASCSTGGLTSSSMAIDHGRLNCRRRCRRWGWFRWCYHHCSCSGPDTRLYCSSGSISK